MKKFFTFISLMFLGIASLSAQTYSNGQWYSYYDAEGFNLNVTTGNLAQGVSHSIELVRPTAGTISFDWSYATSGLGWGIGKVNNTHLLQSTDNGENTEEIGVLTESNVGTYSYTGSINKNANWMNFYRNAGSTSTGNTYQVKIYNIAIPLAKHILFDNNAQGTTEAKNKDFGELKWGESSDPYTVSLRSFYTNGDITVTCDIPEVFRIGSPDNTQGLTYAVGTNACATKKGKSGAQAGGSTLGNIAEYNFDIYFCPQEGKEYSGVVTITDGTSTLVVNVTGIGLKKNQQLTWNQQEGTMLSNVALTSAVTDSQLPIAYTFSEDGIISVKDGALVITGTGTVTVTAAQAGSTRYNAAQSITKTFTINPAVTYGTAEGVTCQGSQFHFDTDNQDYAGGTYEIHIANVYGGDSIITLTVTENTTYNDVTDGATICRPALPYNWDGMSLEEAGEYTRTYETVNGCDSIVTFTLTVNDPTTYTDVVVKCRKEMPFTWNGYEIASEEDNGKTFTTTNAAGCDSVVTLSLTINEASAFTHHVNVCESGLPFTWNGYEIASMEDNGKTFTTTNTFGCDSVVTLELVITNTIHSTDKVVKCASELPFTWNEMEITSMEDNGKTANFTSYANCDSIVTLDLTINYETTAIDAMTICENALDELVWNGINITGEVDENGNAYTFTTVNAAGCDSVVTLNLTITPAIRTTETIVLCDNELPYVWNGIELTDASQNGTTVTLTAANLCDSIVTLDLTINPTYSFNEEKTIYVGAEEIWHGQDLSVLEVGYQELFADYQTATGCDSTYQLNLTILERGTTTYNYTGSICEGDEYNDDNFTALTESGKYHLTLVNSIGGDSIITLTLTVHEKENTILDVLMIYGDETWQENGENRNAGSYVTSDTLTNIYGCDSIITTRTIIAKADQTITWQPDTTQLTVGETLILNAIASSGLEITYILSDEALASIEGTTLTAIEAGELQVTATQEGNENYDAAENVTINLTLLPATAIKEIFGEKTKEQKFIHNGNLYILREGRLYNAQGNRVE